MASLSDMSLPGGDDLLGMTAIMPEAVGAVPRRLQAGPADGGRRATSAGARTGSPVPTSFAGVGAALHHQPDLRAFGRGRGGGGSFSYGGRGEAAGSFDHTGVRATSAGSAFSGGGRGGVGAFGRGAPPNRGGRGGRGGSPYGPVMEGEAGRPHTVGSRFVSDSLRSQLQQRAYAVAAQLDPQAQARLGIPASLGQYHSLVPLEAAPAAGGEPPALGVRSQVLKATSAMSGASVTLRRLSAQQLVPTGDLLASAQQAVEAWSPLAAHPNLVVPRHAFVSAEIDATPALFLVHELHPAAVTLKQAHLQPATSAAGLMQTAAPSEETLWSYLVQLASALRAVHSAHLACHAACLSPSKVLLTSTGRIRVGSLGAGQVLAGPPASRDDLLQLQRADLMAVGHLMLALACTGSGRAPSMDVVAAQYSGDFARIVSFLLQAAEGNHMSSWRGLAAALGERLFSAFDASQTYGDVLLGELATEVDNGRLLRLAARLSAVTERPDHQGDPHWSETGDRYLLKLFRDYVFHQMDESGSPVLDWGHIVECLNKVDAGVSEQIMLLSRDEGSMLVVTYGDVARCLATAYQELQSRSKVPR